jgi:hypothetical protein
MTFIQSLSTREKGIVTKKFVVYARVIVKVMMIVKTVLFVTREVKTESFQAAAAVHRNQKERAIASCLLMAVCPFLEIMKSKCTQNFVLKAKIIVPRAISVGYVKEIVTLYVYDSSFA